jgi:hypothetical protein
LVALIGWYSAPMRCRSMTSVAVRSGWGCALDSFDNHLYYTFELYRVPPRLQSWPEEVFSIALPMFV